MIDSGAALCIIDDRTLAALGVSKLVKPARERLKTFDNSTVHSIGKVELDVSLGRESVKQEFVVIKNVTNRFILPSILVYENNVRIG